MISEPAEYTAAPQLFGDPYPGETLIGTVGGWKDPTTDFQRQWLRCDPDGEFCTNIQEVESGDPETGPSYTVREGDLGYTLRMRVTADVNDDLEDDGIDNEAPGDTEALTAPSAVVVPRPPPSGGGDGSGAGAGGPGGGDALGGSTLGAGTNPLDLVPGPPGLTRLSLTNRRFVVGSAATPTVAGRRRTPRGTTFRFGLSEDASAVFTIQRRLPGRRVGRRCRPPSRKLRKRRKCTRYVRRGALTRGNLSAGTNAVPFSGRIGKKKLAPGSYRVVVVATDRAGNRSRPAIARFTVVRR